MPQQRSLVVLALAIVLGLVAVYLANIWMNSREVQRPAAPVTTKVVVARVPMDYGTEIKPDMVRLIDLPKDTLMQGTFASVGELLPPDKRRLALRAIGVNEPITASHISGDSGRPSLAALLRPGMRAMAVRVGDVSGVGGFVLPGDVVDVLITRTPVEAPIVGDITDVLLRHVHVLATDQNAREDSDRPSVSKTVTLEVSLVDAEKLALAERVGSLSLVLRQPEEKDRHAREQAADQSAATVSLADLRSYAAAHHLPQPAAATAPPARPGQREAVRPSRAARSTTPSQRISIEIVRGTTGTQYEVGNHAGL